MPKRKEIPKLEPSKEIDTYFLKRLKKCFLDPAIHNTKFIVGVERQEFKCNGTALAVISTVFRELLFKPTQSNAYFKDKRSVVELRNITPVGFAALVRFAFAQDPQISPETVVEVIHAAAQFKVHALHNLASAYLTYVLEAFSAEYLVIYLEQATRLGLRFVISECMKCLCPGGPKDFLESKQFSEFPAEFIALLLRCDELPIEEEDIWDCVLRWGKVQAKIRRKTLVNILKLVYRNVRFPLMTTKYFTAEVVPTGVLTQQETLDLFCYLTYPEGKVIDSFSSNPRLLWNNILVRRFKHCADSNWVHEGGKVDCIGVTVNHSCQIIAVGTFVGKGLSKCRVSVFTVKGKKREMLEISDEQDIWRDEQSANPEKVTLRSPVTLLPDQVYEIEVNQKGPPSNRIKEGITVVEESHNGLEISFTWQKASVKSNTSMKIGNIPCVWVQVLSGKRK